ncbi:hypothetical protein HanHA300_Chr08g0291611 [Helianthus annuus]|nr:hypothetical protein HanHA300_Chr08g0291611 [Helianthus annuus]
MSYLLLFSYNSHFLKKQVDPDETLSAVAYKILHNHISSVPVIYMAQGATFPQLLHVACLSGLLKHINRHFEYRIGYLPLLQQPIGSLPIGSWIRDIGGARELLTLLSHEPLSDALRLLLDGKCEFCRLLYRWQRWVGWVAGQKGLRLKRVIVCTCRIGLVCPFL